MKLEGKIIVAQPIQSGVSKNGNNWQRQDFVLEIPGQYPKKVAFSVMNSNIQNFGLAVGQDVDIEIDKMCIRDRCKHGAIFNGTYSNNVWFCMDGYIYDTYKGNPIYSSMSSIPPSWEPIAWMPKPKFEE